MMKNDDLISRSAIMKYINENHSYAGLPMAAHICTMELLTYAPAVDAVEVVHGRWIEDYVYASDPYDRLRYKCSICGRTEEYKEPYCNCGAKMDGGK